jgi:alkane 1-monooxygenase
MAKHLLLSTQYMHFFIEHNRGHHKNVSTDADPASAKYGEWLYVFWARSIFFSYLDAWKLEADRMRKMGKKVFHPENEMLQFLFFQLTLNACILLITGWKGLLSYLLAAFVGILLLETVNYIEHYGLRRKKQGEDYYEKVMPHHSWNSDHVLGRLMLFELTRHSDHHYMASRKFQVLRHFENSPQMPAGYPAMMVLAFVPPLWFYVMHRHIRKLQLA